MKRICFPFDTIIEVAKQAGYSGNWHQQSNRRWRLAVGEAAGLEWSPTRAELSFYGPPSAKDLMRDTVERALRSNLIAEHRRDAGEDDELEEISSGKELLEWLVQYMQSGPKSRFPRPLVACAKVLVRTFLQGEVDDVEMFQMWNNPVQLGHSFSVMTRTSPTRSYSSMLMQWAGLLHDHLVIGDLEFWDAVDYALDAAGLQKEFRERRANGKRCFTSRRSFEQRFRIRVLIGLDDDN